MSITYLLIGGNIGDKFSNIEKAASFISSDIGKILDKSSIVESDPWGFSHPEKFLNMVLKVETELKPSNLLSNTKLIEKKLGRIKSKNGYEARVMDIDILFYDNLIYNNDNLIIPHPRMHLRRFTLLPFCELESAFVHPVFNKTMSEVLDECSDKSNVKVVSRLDYVEPSGN